MAREEAEKVLASLDTAVPKRLLAWLEAEIMKPTAAGSGEAVMLAAARANAMKEVRMKLAQWQRAAEHALAELGGR